MFAKNLERVLHEVCGGSDVSPNDPTEIAERFESLRRYRRLPPGRANRAKHLSPTELAAAVLCLVTAKPGWAGHAVIVLSDLKPAGGVAASFRGIETLAGAVELLLTNDDAVESLRSLTLSCAEHGINSNGFAKLVYYEGVNRRCAFFVSKMAASLLQPGGESEVQEDEHYSPASKCLVLTRAFFETVVRKIVQSASLSIAPEGDGSEYDAEEAQQARSKALGVRAGSRFLNIGVDTQVTWPKEETLVHFDNYQLVLMPKTKEYTQSVHLDLSANRVTDKQALTIINRFLSVLAWCDDQFAVAQGGWSGNPVPVPVHKRDLAFATAHQWLFHRCIPDSNQVRRALAIYREGLNAEEAGLGSYAVLSYFKLLEIRYEGREIAAWISKSLPTVRLSEGDPRLKEFIADCGTETPADYLYKACRIAVAHASDKHPSDADDALEATRLYSAAHVLRLLARRFIAEELGVSEEMYVGT
jgi:hypothetical protein